MPNVIKYLTVGCLICLAVQTTSAEEEQLLEPTNPLSPTARDIENYNVASPEHSLHILVGKEADLNPAERLSELSVKEFLRTSPFFGLRSLLRHNQLNWVYRESKCVNEFRVNDDENWRLVVTFESNPTTDRWKVKKVLQIKNGQAMPVPLQANNPLYQQSLIASSGCDFAEFPSVWQPLNVPDSSSRWNSIDTIEKLKPLDGQKAVFDNLVFYRQDHANPKHKILTAVVSIQLEYSHPDPSKKRFKNGWLISGFEFLDDEGQEYDLEKPEDKSSAIYAPTPLNVFRKKPYQSATAGRGNPSPPPRKPK